MYSQFYEFCGITSSDVAYALEPAVPFMWLGIAFVVFTGIIVICYLLFQVFRIITGG